MVYHDKKGTDMATITDEMMKEMLPLTKPYAVVVLRPGPNRFMEGWEKIIWEHGRNNFSLRADGLLAIVCPISNQDTIAGVGVMNVGPEEAARLYDNDPAVKAGVLTYEVYVSRSFPGDSLPA
jgi:hypothetical protein